jgi:hypothetical protein
MRPARGITSAERWAGLVVCGALACAAGLAITPGPARACSCAAPAWRVERQSVTASDPGASRPERWPSLGRLVVGSSWAELHLEASADGMVLLVRGAR